MCHTRRAPARLESATGTKPLCSLAQQVSWHAASLGEHGPEVALGPPCSAALRCHLAGAAHAWSCATHLAALVCAPEAALGGCATLLLTLPGPPGSGGIALPDARAVPVRDCKVVLGRSISLLSGRAAPPVGGRHGPARHPSRSCT